MAKRQDMFILVCRYNRVFAYPGDDVALTSHLSPETSAVGMEIRWFRGIECIYLYKNGQVTVGRGYEGRVSLFTEELQRGNVSLLLSNVGQADTGIYSCQVITGEHRVERTIHLYMSGTETLSPERWALKIAEQDSLDMEESVHSLEMTKILQKKEKELQDKIKELESTSVELRRITSLLQERENDVDSMRKVANDREVHLRNMASELEACKKELDTLGLTLQEKDNERKVLLEELQASTKTLQTLTAALQEREWELEEEKKHHKETEKQLQTVNAMIPTMVDVHQGPSVSELMEKCEEMLSKMYQDPKDQLEDIERWIHKKREERRVREEQERTEALEQEFLSYVVRVKEQIKEEHEKIVTSAKNVAGLEEELEHAETDEERSELEVQLNTALDRQREGEKEMENLAKEIDKQRNAIEAKHEHETEEIREKYETVLRIEAETNLLKIILSDVQAYFRNMTAQFQRAFTKQAIERMMIVVEAAGEDEPDEVENSCREEEREHRMSPVEEESSNEMLEEPELEAEQPRYIEDSQENDDCEETLEQTSKTRAVLRREGAISAETQKSEGVDSENETLELEEHYNMVNGVMIREQEEVQSDIEEDEKQEKVREHDNEINEEDMDYTQ